MSELNISRQVSEAYPLAGFSIRSTGGVGSTCLASLDITGPCNQIVSIQTETKPDGSDPTVVRIRRVPGGKSCKKGCLRYRG